MPQMQRAYRNADFKTYRKLYFLCQAVALTSTFCICIWMPEIYALLIRNANLAKSCDIASLLCFANVVFSFYAFMSAPAFIEKKTMQLLWLVFVPGILNFLLCYAFEFPALLCIYSVFRISDSDLFNDHFLLDPADDTVLCRILQEDSERLAWRP